MRYVVTATWHAKKGEEAKIREIIEIMTPLTRAEPGCRLYVAHLSPDDEQVFFMYEQYDDEAAFRAHTSAAYFQEHVIGQVVPRLESRQRAVYLTLD